MVTTADEVMVVEPETTATGVVTVAMTAPSQCPFETALAIFLFSESHINLQWSP